MSILTERASKYRSTTVFGISLAVGIATSFLIEWLQYYIPGRTSSLIDVAANGMGNLFGMLLYLLDKSFTKIDR